MALAGRAESGAATSQPPGPPPLASADRALRLVDAFGKTGTAFQALGRAMQHWFDVGPDGDRGLVAYVDTGGAWVAAGEPIAAPEERLQVAARFVGAARAAGRRASFFATEGVLATAPQVRRVQIGEQPFWDPAEWDASVRAHKSMREQLRRARAKGLSVREVKHAELSADAATAATLDRLIDRWHASRPMAEMRFLVDMAPFSTPSPHAERRRLFVVERRRSGSQTYGADIVALLSMAPIPARNGWLCEHLVRDPQAPNGTAELLVDHAMRIMHTEGVRDVTLGLAPLSGDVNRWLRAARTLSRPLFNFVGLSAFKRKLRPQRWEPMYLAYPDTSHAAIAMRDGLRAFAGGSLLRFGVRTSLRGPAPVLRALAWLLVPWTLVLALSPSAQWFPSPWVHGAWVLFDVGLIVALRRLQQTRSVPLARALALAVSADAILTIAQAVLWNLPRAAHAGTLLAIVIACAGPLLTAPVLWGAARRLHMLARRE